VPALDGCEDAQLVQAAQAGDCWAFTELVHRYDRLVLQIAWSLLGDREEAREVYQETFLRAWKSLRELRQNGNFRCWVMRIAVHICLDRLRSKKRQALAMALEDEPELADRRDYMACTTVDSNPFRLVASEELRQRIQVTLQKLAPRDRVVFELRHFHGLSVREVAAILGTSEQAVKTALYRAHQVMRQALEGYL